MLEPDSVKVNWELQPQLFGLPMDLARWNPVEQCWVIDPREWFVVQEDVPE